MKTARETIIDEIGTSHMDEEGNLHVSGTLSHVITILKIYAKQVAKQALNDAGKKYDTTILPDKDGYKQSVMLNILSTEIKLP